MRDRVSRGIAIAVGAALLATLGIAGAGAHTIKYDSNVTLKVAFEKLERGTNEYKGRVTGETKACSKSRTVTLYRKNQGVPAVEVGNDQTGDDGKYSIALDNSQAGKYYTRASKRTYGGVGHDHTCLSARSNTVELEKRRESAARRGAAFESTVKIVNYIVDMSGNAFIGRVKSENPNCKPERKGKIFQRGPGDDVLIGKETTNPQGFFAVPHEPVTAGKFYAKVGKDEIPAGTCKGDRSPIFELN